MKRRNKWSRTGTEMGSSMSQMLEKLGGSGGGARRVSKKAKTNVSKTGKADSTASGVGWKKVKKKYSELDEGTKDLVRRASKTRALGRKNLRERKANKKKNLDKMIETYGEKYMKERYGKMYGDWLK